MHTLWVASCATMAALSLVPAMAQVGGLFLPAFNHDNFGTHAVSALAWARADNQPYWSFGKVRAMHMALCPPPLSSVSGSGDIRVLVFDGNEDENPDGTQFWSLMDPTKSSTDPDKFWNFELSGLKSGEPGVPVAQQRDADLGCAGHGWMEDGRLFLSAGTSQIYPGPPPQVFIHGAWFAYVFDPSAALGNGMWQQIDDMEQERWYPTATYVWDDAQRQRMVSMGGRAKGAPWIGQGTDDTYEAWDPLTTQWTFWRPTPTTQDRKFRGPEYLGIAYLHLYPRVHLLGNGELYRAGMTPDGAVMHHLDGLALPIGANTSWATRGATSPDRLYGASLLHPDIDPVHTNAVMLIGGADLIGGTVLPNVDICKGTATAPGPFPDGWSWKALPALNLERWFLNAVVLPDASIVVFGGGNTQGPPIGPYPIKTERYTGNAWVYMADANSPHDYHSTALLLPDGTVLLAGGDHRGYDYEIYVPPYLTSGLQRPAFSPDPPALPAILSYGAEYTIGFGAMDGATVSKVVLMRPGSITHHSDFDARYVELATVAGNQAYTVKLTTPPGPPSPAYGGKGAPRGWYMMFLVSNQGVPSVAHWVRLGV